ncbi:MAG TPA: amidohydrolase family protein, partial [Edaphobacter sp.]|nr:amidohydrolase family protein [Edaphobacter sp.]
LRVLHREHGLPLSRIVELMSASPAAITSLAGRGTLGSGQVADVVLFDAGAEWSFDANSSRSKSRNTPFDGAAMLGRVRSTICEGRIVYRA